MQEHGEHPDERSNGGTSIERIEPTKPAAVSQTNETGAAVYAARVKAEVEARTVVALNRPRDIERFRRRIVASCQRSRFADGAWYAKPIGGGKVYGFSIRFAEECARHYGNLDIDSSVVSEDDERRTIRCCVTDLEVNLPWSMTIVVHKTVERKSSTGAEVIRSRVNSKGETVYVLRATDDQIFTQQNALVSKTIRNLILNHVPSDIREEAEETIAETLKSEVDNDPTAYRKKLVDAFFNLGVTSEQLVAFLGKSLADANNAELFLLSSIGKAIKSGEGTWADAMEGKLGTVADAAARKATAAAEGDAAETKGQSPVPPTAAKGKGAAAALDEKLK